VNQEALSPNAASVLDFQDYRAFLRAELEKGLRANAAYSLRAFAKRCGVSPSYLSRVLNGQRKLSSRHAALIAQGLGLNPEERGHFLSLLGETAMVPAAAAPTSRVLEMESFQLIADWHHFAILALAKTRGFKPDPGWVANRLGINVNTARGAIERLQRLNFLRLDKGRWIACDDGNLETGHDVASTAVRENHRQHLHLAAGSLEAVDVSLREFANASLSVRLADLPSAKRRLRTFLDRFIRDFERAEGEEVFQLNLQLHPLTKIEKGRA